MLALAARAQSGEIRGSVVDAHGGEALAKVAVKLAGTDYRLEAGARRSGKAIQTADAWIASAAQQWQIPLVTTDFRDYAAIPRLDIVPISS